MVAGWVLDPGAGMLKHPLPSDTLNPPTGVAVPAPLPPVPSPLKLCLHSRSFRFGTATPDGGREER